MVEAVESIGANATGIQGDVSVPTDLDRLHQTSRGQGRRVDVLFANAGGGSFATLEQVTEEHFDQTLDINVKGLLFTVQ
jgi:NAD(P)-dependent dehydrogenase (short-subunit alcohol dehydrogenase family)